MKFKSLSDLPQQGVCRECEREKPILQMVVVHYRKENHYRLRSRCKDCHNRRERGARRDYKRDYQRKWRKNNRSLNRSYWKDNPIAREQARINASARFAADHEAILLQGRLRRHGNPVGIQEAKELLARFGRCYPGTGGLTKAGLREAERIRARFRRRQQPGEKIMSSFEIRLMVYEDDERNNFVIKPELQPALYQTAAENLKNWHRRRRDSASGKSAESD